MEAPNSSLTRFNATPYIYRDAQMVHRDSESPKEIDQRLLFLIHSALPYVSYDDRLELHDFGRACSLSTRQFQHLPKQISGLGRNLVIRPFGNGYYIECEQGDRGWKDKAAGHFKTRSFFLQIDLPTGSVQTFAGLIVRDHHDTKGNLLNGQLDNAASKSLKEDFLSHTLNSIRHPGARHIDAGSEEQCECVQAGELVVFLFKKIKIPMVDFIRNLKPSAHDFLMVMKGVAEGLAAIHQFGMVHRDVAPDNMLVEQIVNELGNQFLGQIADPGMLGRPDQALPLLTKPTYKEADLAQQAWKYDSQDDMYAFGNSINRLMNSIRFSSRAKDQLDMLIGLLTSADKAARPTAEMAAGRIQLIIDSLNSSSNDEDLFEVEEEVLEKEVNHYENVAASEGEKSYDNFLATAMGAPDTRSSGDEQVSAVLSDLSFTESESETDPSSEGELNQTIVGGPNGLSMTQHGESTEETPNLGQRAGTYCNVS